MADQQSMAEAVGEAVSRALEEDAVLQGRLPTGTDERELAKAVLKSANKALTKKKLKQIWDQLPSKEQKKIKDEYPDLVRKFKKKGRGRKESWTDFLWRKAGDAAGEAGEVAKFTLRQAPTAILTALTVYYVSQQIGGNNAADDVAELDNVEIDMPALETSTGFGFGLNLFG